jgi:stage IV sporulation protein B
LFGLIPFRSLTVDVLPSVELFPGGHSIGVVLHSEGVLVIDHSAVTTAAGEQYSPAKMSGVRVGDLILRVNGTVVRNKDHVGALVAEAARKDEEVKLTIRREGELLTKHVRPQFDVREQTHLIGLWIKDGAAGVGTLTFYDTTSRKFGALGHMITDNRTHKPIEVQSGKIVQAQIAGIDRGQEGRPGEKIGHFSDRAIALGTIEQNGSFGISGSLDRVPEHPLFDSPIPVALAKEVQEGPAQIVTVVKGRSMQRFAVTIERAALQKVPQGKGMVIKIKDSELLEATGGIVQGMSGSPIIQGGRLVGAVTHVFVNDPTRGYGVYAEWMLQQAGVFAGSDSKQSISVLP